jgi:hypothetical protein
MLVLNHLQARAGFELPPCVVEQDGKLVSRTFAKRSPACGTLRYSLTAAGSAPWRTSFGTPRKSVSALLLSHSANRCNDPAVRPAPLAAISSETDPESSGSGSFDAEVLATTDAEAEAAGGEAGTSLTTSTGPTLNLLLLLLLLLLLRLPCVSL